MARLLLRRTLSGFVPDDEASAELARKFAVNETYKAEVTKPRNLKMHRRYWALVTMVFHNCDQFKSVEQCHQYLKLRAGHSTTVVSKTTGEVYLVPDSIAFDKLDDTGFQEFWNKIVGVICEEIIPGLSADDLQLELEKLCGLAA
jgi:hypothetical protein